MYRTMTKKAFRDGFYKMTRDSDEFTVGKMCIDFFGILEFLKYVFVILIAARMFYMGNHTRFFFLIFLLGFSNKLFYYLVDKCLPRK